MAHYPRPLDPHTDAPTQTGRRLFIDTSSGAMAEPKGLAEVLSFLRPGDSLVVWRLDRLGRTFDAILHTAGDLKPHGGGFRSLTEQINTTTRRAC